MRTATLMIAVLLVVVCRAPAETYVVPNQHKDLEKAISMAHYGDTVLVHPGRYHVQTRLRSGVKMLSAQGPGSTVLWNKRWHILQLIDCDMETQVSGFTFEGKGCNIAVACTLGAPVISDNVIVGPWDGINLQKCSALVKSNTISGCNRGITLDYCSPEIIGNTIFKNGEGISVFTGSPVISRCTIRSNGRGVFILGHSYPTIGGDLPMANDIYDNSFNIYNEGRRMDGALYTDEREVAIATHNYWGSDCPDKQRFRGEVVFAPWADAAHDTVMSECPEQPASEVNSSQ